MLNKVFGGSISAWFRRLSALRLGQHIVATWFLVRDPRTPRLARWLAWLVLAYALSPIDLIPDFIPVLGQLDDLLLIPLGLALVVRLAPPAVWQDCQARAVQQVQRLPRLAWGAVAVGLTWLLMLLALASLLFWLAASSAQAATRPGAGGGQGAAAHLGAGSGASSEASSGWPAVVTRVTDGDTLWVRPEQGGAPVKIRLAGLDAPERCQEGGPQSQQALARRSMNLVVRVESVATDDYGRTVARLWDGRKDIGAAHVAAGWAWSQRYHGRHGAYDAEELAAREARRGIFRDGHAQDPRDFRDRHGPCPMK